MPARMTYLVCRKAEDRPEGVTYFDGTWSLSRTRAFTAVIAGKRIRGDRLKDIVFAIDIKFSELAVLCFKFTKAVEQRRMLLPHFMHRVDQIPDLYVEVVPHFLIDLTGQLPNTVAYALGCIAGAAEDAQPIIEDAHHIRFPDSVSATLSIGERAGARDVAPSLPRARTDRTGDAHADA